MTTIHLTTFIAAPAQRVFDLSRSIKLHQLSMQHTGEKAIGGIRDGLMNLDDHVTWQAKHLWKLRVMEMKITAMKPYSFFKDEMVTGDFQSMKHDHHFKEVQNGTIMIDLFSFAAPYGLVGKMAEILFLKKYMKRLLDERNAVIKTFAEGDGWRKILN